MSAERKFPKITVTKKAEYSIKKGHPWVYDAEITSGAPNENGELCDVYSSKDSYLGTGFWSEKSKIRIRLLSSNANERFERSFFERRIKYAVDYRRAVMGNDF
ncbi:MAG: rRNA large subunit methyltransferase I, partial [Clostridia bacterium]|nr:rRNA large subunit methyltransferase I [Clostridia bacterium]